MYKILSTLSKTGFLALSYFFSINQITSAQITSDGTVNTQVNQNENVAEITGGEARGNNLFHSFQDFSVVTGNEASFLNGDNINNIFSRVTGGNISNIDGAIQANGSASLFLINPAGIIFGQNARLDIGGSFYGGSADSILFPDGIEFSANDTAAPVLTINAPIRLNFRDEPADVSVQSNNLSTTGQNLNLFGGEINFNNGTINALGNNINLGAVLSAGTVILDENLNLDFSNVSPADITFSNSQLNVNGSGGGEININARNVSLSNNSTFSAGINSDSSTSNPAGNITINATETVALDSGSTIRNNISQISSGNAGNIFVTAQNLSLADNSILLTNVMGLGDGGDIIINVSSLDLKGRSDFSTNLSG